jgi:hypothetical protein
MAVSPVPGWSNAKVVSAAPWRYVNGDLAAVRQEG